MKTRKKLVLSLATIAVVLTMIAGITMAWFTDTEKATANFNAGVLDISIDDGKDQAIQALDFNNLRPLKDLDGLDAELTQSFDEKGNLVLSNTNTNGFNPVPVYFNQFTVKNDGTLPTQIKISLEDGTIPTGCKMDNIIANAFGGVEVGDPAKIDCDNGLASVVEVYLYELDTISNTYVRSQKIDPTQGNIVINTANALGAGEEITYVVGAFLPSTVDNTYQGKHYHANIRVDAAQADTGAEFAQ